jgi:hypothetical protein
MRRVVQFIDRTVAIMSDGLGNWFSMTQPK